jgi:hypothetical protein
MPIRSVTTITFNLKKDDQNADCDIVRNDHAFRPSSVISEGFAVAQVKSSGIRPNAKAVVSAMPVVKAKARARIAAIFFMAVPHSSAVWRLPEQG